MATGRKFRKTREIFLATINSHNIFLPTFFSMKLYFLRVKPFSTYTPYDLFSVPHPPSLQTCVHILINPPLEHVILSIYYPRRFGFARLSVSSYCPTSELHKNFFVLVSDTYQLDISYICYSSR